MMESLVFVVVRSVAVYLFIIMAIRLFGKKELSQLSIIDLVFILLISNSVQNAMVGDNTTLAGGLTAAGALFVVNWVLKNMIFKSEIFSKALQGRPIILVYEGKIMEKHLDTAKISHDELEAAFREHGVASINKVNLAILEVDGTISVLSDDYKHHTRKKRAHKFLSLSN